MKKYLVPFLILFLILSGCRDETEPSKNRNFIAVVWNVQSLFDGEDTGNEFSEFRAASGWNQEKYEARLLSISEAITRMILSENSQSQQQVPDFIGLVELENSRVMDDLVRSSLLAKHGYNYTFFGSNDGTTLGIGAASRIPFTETLVHSITIDGQTIPRPVLEVHINPANEPLVFFICHWKSKLGGAEATEPLRRASARIIRRRIMELREEKPGTPVIIMGDLNVNHDEFFRYEGTIICSLLPNDPDAALLAESTKNHEDFLIVCSEKPPRIEYFDSSVPVLYSPWGNELADGSYFFRDNWETIDHLLLSDDLFNNTGWVFDSCIVLNFPPFANDKGLPRPYMARNGFGLSDHLPLLLYLTIADPGYQPF